MYLLEGDASELSVYHEMAHLEVWYKKLPKMHIIDEEKYVWEEIWKARHRWTDDELIASYKYVNEKYMTIINLAKIFLTYKTPKWNKLLLINKWE